MFRAFLFILAVAVLSFAAMQASFAFFAKKFDCPADARKALAAARTALQSSDPETRSKGALCLVNAVEQLQTQIDDIVAGRTVLERVTSVGGYFNGETPTKESR